MIVKEEIKGPTQVPNMQAGSSPSSVYYRGATTLPGYTNVIRYGDGPKYRNGRLQWKPCLHETTLRMSGTTGVATLWNPGAFDVRWVQLNGVVPYNTADLPNLPKAQYDRGVLNDVVSQVDLNCRDTVLYYSGVLQAIPLVGGALRFNKIMKDLAKSLKKGFLNQPFTTVIKSAISLDFIDRFVVKPTIDDARKFNDAVNYIFRVYQTMHERNVAPFALQAKRTRVFQERTSSGDMSYIGNNGISYKSHLRVEAVSKAFLYLSAQYDTAAVDPIHLWATRTGLTRPLESVWDLVPFSFVIDYFTRAGDFIQRLGEEIDRQGALEGKITKIHACWGSFLRRSFVELEGTAAHGDYRYGGYVGTFTPQKQIVQRSSYERFPIGNPWLELTQLEEDDSFLHVNLSLTRQRTLAQLLIQAKL